MIYYILRRIMSTLLVLLCVAIFAFALIRMAPGSPALLLVPDGASAETIREMEIYLGLDRPLYIQFFRYLSELVRGNLGVSTAYRVPVMDVIINRLPLTIKLCTAGVVLGILISIPLGIYAGAHRGKAADFFAMFFALLGQSMSPVWLGILLIYVFSVQLGVLPSMGATSWRHFIMPAIVLGYPMAAQITRIARSGMINVLGEDYITSMHAKGIRRGVILYKYALKNALIPVIVLIGLYIGSFLAGSIIAETIFGLPGIGQLTNQAVGNRDYALVQSMMVISAFLFTMVNFAVDIINSFIDPRIRLE